MKKEIIIGIDVSKDKLDLCLLPVGSSTPLEMKVISNQSESIAKYLKLMDKRYKRDNILVCLEHTGHYGLELCLELQQMKFDYTLVPALEIKNSVGMTRGKTDQIDAQRIAAYAWRFIDKIKLTTLPTNELILMKELLALRDQNVKMSIQLQNSLKVHTIASNLLKNEMVVKRISNQINIIKNEIAEIEQQLQELVNANESIKQNFTLLLSIKGIGPITAMVLIITTQNFKRITEGRKYNSYAGLAPFKCESGIMSKRAKVSNLANKNIKRLLHNGACSAVCHDNELKAYYNRKREEGKAKLSILNAVACKLVYRVFAVINRQTPFVNLYQNNFA
jgi:transposase